MKHSVCHFGGRVCFVVPCAIRILTLTLGILVVQHAAAARQPLKIHRVGVLLFTSQPLAMEELRQGLHELGYVEGRSLTLEVRSAEGYVERLADLATELVRLPVDLIVAHTTPAVRAAQLATTTIPIVAAVMTDPVRVGSADSLAYPGGNITGSFASRLEVQAKRLELLKEALPGVTRVAVLLAEGHSGNQAWRTALERIARELGVKLHPVEVYGPDDLERALSVIAHGQAEALVVSDAVQLGLHAKRIGDFIIEHRLPTIGASRQPSYLMAYWVRSDLLWRRAAVFIDKIRRVPGQATSPWSRPISSCWSSTSRLPRHSGSRCPRTSSSWQTRSSSRYRISAGKLPSGIVVDQVVRNRPFFGLLRVAHLMILSAWNSTICGMLRPSLCAVCRLMINSNFSGCSTGMSNGSSLLQFYPHTGRHPCPRCCSRDHRPSCTRFRVVRTRTDRG